jgi:hypothetical protein
LQFGSALESLEAKFLKVLTFKGSFAIPFKPFQSFQASSNAIQMNFETQKPQKQPENLR